MKMNNTELAAHIEVLRARAQDAAHEYMRAGLHIDIDDLVNNRITAATIYSEKMHKAYLEADDKVRHAEGWLEQRAILRGVKETTSTPSRQIIGDLLRERLGA